MPGLGERSADVLDWLQGLLNHIRFIKDLNRSMEPRVKLIKLALLLAWPITWLWPDGLLAWVKWIYGAFLLLIFVHDWLLFGVDMPLPHTRMQDPEFLDRVRKLAAMPISRAAKANSPSDIRRAATFEQEAFGAHSGRSIDKRQKRLEPWLGKRDGLAQFIVWNDRSVGYSVMIPISAIDAERYTKGQLKEWGHRVAPFDGKRIHLYAQGAYLDRIWRRQGPNGLAHAAVIRHAASLITSLVSEYDSAARPRAVPFTILADAGTFAGKQFLKGLGFAQLGGRSADGRLIYELKSETAHSADPPLALALIDEFISRFAQGVDY